MKRGVAVIPARGGSKGVPRKNLVEINSIPLIAYSISACNLSTEIEDFVISTDDQEIADIAIKYGGNVPFLRPKEISGDSSHDRDYLIHAQKWFEKEKNFSPDFFYILRPTTPLRDPNLIDEAIKKFKLNTEATSLVSIHEFPETPAKMFGLDGEYLHGLSPLDPRKEYFTLPRQQFPKAYIGNGYIDIVKRDVINEVDSFYGNRILSFLTPDYGEIDIISDIKKIEFYINKENFKIFDYLKNIGN